MALKTKCRMSNIQWTPSASEIEIWSSPAGWAESVYKAGLHIDTTDPFTFLNRVSTRSFNVKMSLTDSTVKVELEHVAFLGSDNSYEKAFPLESTRDLIIIAMNDAGQKAIAVVSCLEIIEFSLKASMDDHLMIESLKLKGTKYFPLKEIK